MPEGVTTRSQAETLHALSEIVHQHEATFANQTKLMETMHQAIMDLQSSVAKLEKQPALLPSPPSSSNTPTQYTIHPTTPNPQQNPPAPLDLTYPQSTKPPKLDLPPFTGDNVTSWLFQIERFFMFHETPEDQKLHIAAFYMSGPALQWVHWMHRTHQLTSWDSFVRNLELRFGPSAYQNPEGSLYKLRQHASVSSYLTEFETLSTRTSGLSSENLLNCFVSGLRDDIRRELYLLRPTSLHQAIGMAKLVEEKCNDSRRYGPKPYNPKPTPYNPPYTTTSSDSQPSRLPVKRLTPAEMAARRDRGLCFNCDDQFTPGHRCRPKFLCLIVDDESLHPDPPDNPQSDLNPIDMNPNPIDSEPDINPTDNPSISLHALEGHFVPTTLRLEASIYGKPIVVLVDGGSTHNFMQTRIARFLQLPVEPSQHMQVTVGNGDSLHCEGACNGVPLSMGGQSFEVSLHLLPIYGADLVLGVQWLADVGPVLFDYKALWLSFVHNGTQLKLHGLSRPSLAQMTLRQIQRLTHTCASASMFHLIATVSPEPLHTTNPSLPVLPPDIPPPYSDDLNTLLRQFQATFLPPKGLPPHRNSDHRINLSPGAAPVNVRPYRYPHFQKTEIERLITEMLAEGIIRPSSSPFSSPVLLVKKKDGSWRFCVDYRALNAVTIRDRFPIPTVDELLDELHGATIFSKLDLRSGYHQLRMHHEDIHKTAFRTHEGHYEFLVMPFGLSNAPSSFQAEMNSIFRHLLRKTVLVFFDDILVYSKSWPDHVRHLHEVLQILQLNSFYAKPSKCDLARSSLAYLGHIISGSGVAVDPEKIKAISQWPCPTSVKQLRAFLGLTGYYRKFVANYASLVAPLTQLLRKDAFIWTALASEAFNALKKAMTSTPVLALPDFTQSFTVQTDASGSAVGAVLSQQGRPIAFFSRILTPQLRTTSVYNQELCAVVQAVLKWRQYLLGNHFTIVIDHQPLKTLLTQTVQTPEQQRWVSKLLGFDFNVIYTPGKDNIPADALSRLPVAAPPELCAISTPVLGILRALRILTTTNTATCKLLTDIQTSPASFPDYTLRDDLILYRNRLLVPDDSAVRQLIIHEFHNTPIGGHAGIQRTVARISSNFYWPGLRKDVTDYINQCAICQQVKYPTMQPSGFLQPLPIPEQIWESISMDFITNLPSSAGKTIIWVIVDRLTKYSHFVPLTSGFTAITLASAFVQEIARLHGFPKDIISDRDPLFMSQFWQELFRLQGTTLSTSSAYHPQTDGQTETEVLNRCLEDYLRCFVSDNAKDWTRFLPWAELSYNTAWHSAIRMTPFEAVYGRRPPSLRDYIPGSAAIATVDDTLAKRQQILTDLKANLARAQSRMKNQADQHRKDREFAEGDWVFLKLQPYRQHSITRRASTKLAKRFYGPFKVIERIGPVAYRLELPAESKVHNVFHVSLLKQCRGNPHEHVIPLPPDLQDLHPVIRPDKIIGFRHILQHGMPVPEFLVQWEHQIAAEATWEQVTTFIQRFPAYDLEDKVLFDAAGNVTGIKGRHQRKASKEYKRLLN
ncbi:unnamed protein product [Rhodiola kirilowii]